MKKHYDRYFLLSVIIFLSAGTLHGLRFLYGWDLVLGTYSIPEYISALAVIITLSMAAMGLGYLNKK